MNAVHKTENTRRRNPRNNQARKPVPIPVFEPTANPVSNNMLLSTSGIEPEVGMGATLCYHHDRHAATIIDVQEYKGNPVIVVQEDFAERLDYNGASFEQHYHFKINPRGRKYLYMFRKGRWEGVKVNESTGRIIKARNNPALIIGTRDHYFDFTK